MNGGGRVIGREAELQRISAFVRSVPDGPGVLVIEGEAGAGKTTLWRSGVEGIDTSTTILSCRPVETEATLSFAGLGDLLDGVLDDGVLTGLPGPQRRALEAALLLGDEVGGRRDHRAVGAATMSTLKALSRDRALVIAIDDLQWLDRPSARALAFALRRFTTEPIGLLASLRSGATESGRSELTDVFDEGRVQRLQVGPMSVGAVERVLAERLGLTLTRTALLHLHQTSRGNPFFAIELGRALVETGATPGPGQPLPVPRDLHALLLQRVMRLSADVRDALLLASLLSHPTEDVLARAVGSSWDRLVDRAHRSGIIEVAHGVVRFTHPLLASAVAGSATPRQLREAHRQLAGAVNDEEEHARHLALAGSGQDETVAAALEQASEHARRRGAPDAAAELAELARDLTPEGQRHDTHRRRMLAGEARFAAGDSSRAAELFTEAAALAAPGVERAEARWRLAKVRYQHDDVAGSAAVLEEALREAGDDLHLRVAIEQDLTYPSFLRGDVRSALRHARAAAELAERVGAVHALSGALFQVVGLEFLSGLEMRWDVMNRAIELMGDERNPVLLGPTMPAVHVFLWIDRLDQARSLLLEGERQLIERGEDGALPFVWYRLAELDCWSGEWERGYKRAADANRLAVQTGEHGIRPATAYAAALLAAHLGRVGETHAYVEQGAAAATSSGALVGIGMNLSVLGFLELSLGHPDQAHALFGPLVAGARAGGLGDPAPMWWLPDEIEALVALGEYEEAAALIDWLDQRSAAVDRPRGLAGAARGRALIATAEGRTAEALNACDDALRQHDRLHMPFDRARTLLVRGQVARRARKWGTAREALGEAVAVFDRLGALLWAERARDELARIGGRPAGPLELSDGERRIAELVAAGRTNREVAEVLFMSPKTVSASLGRVYRKLGVSSRTEMAARLHGVRSSADRHGG